MSTEIEKKVPETAAPEVKMSPEMAAAHQKMIAAADEVEKVVVGKRTEIIQLLTAMLAGAHVLIEDVPGTGKTTLASTLARVTGLDFKRAQFTPDVMASDITGFHIYNRQKENFEFREGLVMCNLLLADEINRASPKTQSALLEAMEEGRVTVDGDTMEIPDPFMVIATQNPAGYVGTYPLPEAQLDRFALKISMGYPAPTEEINIIKARKSENPLKAVKPTWPRPTPSCWAGTASCPMTSRGCSAPPSPTVSCSARRPSWPIRPPRTCSPRFCVPPRSPTRASAGSGREFP